MTAPDATALARAIEALEWLVKPQSERARDTSFVYYATFIRDHAPVILAALRERERSAAAPERPLRFVMRGDAARTVVLLYAAGDGNDLHGEVVAELRPPFAGSGGGPTSEAWRSFVETLVGAWNDAGFANSVRRLGGVGGG